jgi:hypothetical protein
MLMTIVLCFNCVMSDCAMFMLMLFVDSCKCNVDVYCGMAINEMLMIIVAWL